VFRTWFDYENLKKSTTTRRTRAALLSTNKMNFYFHRFILSQYACRHTSVGNYRNCWVRAFIRQRRWCEFV